MLEITKREMLTLGAASVAALTCGMMAPPVAVVASDHEGAIIPMDGRTVTRAQYPDLFSALPRFKWGTSGDWIEAFYAGVADDPQPEFLSHARDLWYNRLRSFDWSSVNEMTLPAMHGGPGKIERLNDGQWAMVTYNTYVYVRNVDGFRAGHAFGAYDLASDQSKAVAANA